MVGSLKSLYLAAQTVNPSVERTRLIKIDTENRIVISYGGHVVVKQLC